MTDMQVHSCSYYCDRPECIKAQRDEFRENLLEEVLGALTSHVQPLSGDKDGERGCAVAFVRRWSLEWLSRNPKGNILAFGTSNGEDVIPLYIHPLPGDKDGWMPIESAPRHGMLRVWLPEFGTYAASEWKAYRSIDGKFHISTPFDQNGKQVSVSNCPEPLYWQPLSSPPPPKEESHD